MKDNRFPQTGTATISHVKQLKYSLAFILSSYLLSLQLSWEAIEKNHKNLFSFVFLGTILSILFYLVFYHINKKRIFNSLESSISMNIAGLFETNKSPISLMFKSITRKEINDNKTKNTTIPLYPLAKGKLKDIEEVDDSVYSNKTLGGGFAVTPFEGNVYSPVDGKIVSLFPTKHAIGIQDENNIEYLIHIGIDTIDLNGHGFHNTVKLNQNVKAGDLLTEMDLDYILTKKKTTDILFITLSPNLIESLDLVDDKRVGLNESIGKITLK